VLKVWQLLKVIQSNRSKGNGNADGHRTKPAQIQNTYQKITIVADCKGHWAEILRDEAVCKWSSRESAAQETEMLLSD